MALRKVLLVGGHTFAGTHLAGILAPDGLLESFSETKQPTQSNTDDVASAATGEEKKQTLPPQTTASSSESAAALPSEVPAQDLQLECVCLSAEQCWDTGALADALTAADVVLVDVAVDTHNVQHVLHVINEAPERWGSLLVVGVSTVLTWSSSGTASVSENASAINQRAPSSRWLAVKQAEDGLMGLNKHQGISAVVLATGLQYGHAQTQDGLLDVIKRAWTGQPLVCIGEGNNVVPVVHIQSVASIVRSLIQRQNPPPRYIVATDPVCPTQRQLLEALSQAGGAPLQSVSEDHDGALLNEYGDYALLTCNLDCKACTFVKDAVLCPEWSLGGNVTENMNAILMEYASSIGHVPLLVSVIGAPMSGKTHYAQEVASQLGYPLLTIPSAIESVLSAQAESEVAVEVKMLLQTREEEQSKGKKGSKSKAKAHPPGKHKPRKKGAAAVPVDLNEQSDDLNRLPTPLLARVMAQALQDPVCKLKGAVLEGFPRTLEEAKEVLLSAAMREDLEAALSAKGKRPKSGAGQRPKSGHKDKKKSGKKGAEEEEEPPEDPEEVARKERARQAILLTLDRILVLSCSEETARARQAQLKPQDIIAEHNDEAGFERRWWTYDDIIYRGPDGASSDPLDVFTLLTPLTAEEREEKEKADAEKKKHAHGKKNKEEEHEEAPAPAKPPLIPQPPIYRLSTDDNVNTSMQRVIDYMRSGQLPVEAEAPENATPAAQDEKVGAVTDTTAATAPVEPGEQKEKKETEEKEAVPQMNELAHSPVEEPAFQEEKAQLDKELAVRLMDTVAGPTRAQLAQEFLPALLDTLLSDRASKGVSITDEQRSEMVQQIADTMAMEAVESS